MTTLTPLRHSLRTAILADQPARIAALTAQANLTPQDRAAIATRAAALIRQVRAAGRSRLTETFLAEYGLSTAEGVAQLDARKALSMFAKLNTPIIGMIENMSSYICPNCGHEAHIFGHGGAAAEAAKQGMPFLGEIPLDLAIRLAGDDGTPIVAAKPDGPQSQAFVRIARGLIGKGLV